MAQNKVDKFWSLCEDATKSWEATPDTKKYEPSFLRILNFIKSNEDFHSEFKKGFIQIIRNPDLAIWEIVMFCMRDLKWREVYEVAHFEHSVSNDIRTKDALEKIMEVFEDEWEDADLFEYYSR
jgi:hypothetical protein